jgi:osmotically inducible protein OsmC
MTTRMAEAEWKGSLKEGSGQVRLGSGVFEGAYSFPSRFENGPGTNPEELIAAAHAGCFSMALSAILGKDGFTAARIHTVAKVQIGTTEAGVTLTRIDLATEGDVPRLDEPGFQRYAELAKTSCLVSRALAGVPKITLAVKFSQRAEQ